MLIRDIIFYGLLAAIPAYFINRWMIRKIQPGKSVARFLVFLVAVLTAATAYAMSVSYILFRFVWPIE